MTIPAALYAANAPLNAIVDWAEDISIGDGPTVGVKANIAVSGLPWTAGMALYRDRIAARDAEVVMRLRAAGYAILGTLNMDEAALGAKTDNPWFGDTHNPHRIGFTAGGSSGGSGAAVAAGLCDIALGTDTMGSVRIPASYCGVYGFKPANAEISRDGVESCEPTLDAVGLISGSLQLIERALAICTGTDPTFDLPMNGAGFATLYDLGGVDCDPAVKAVHDRVCAGLGAANDIVLPHPLSRVRFAGFIKTAKALAISLADADPELLSPRLRTLIDYGRRRRAVDWETDQEALSDTAAALHAALDRYSYLILPTTPGVAFPLTQEAPANQADFTCLANIANLPALSIPVGLSDGLPIGMQLIGRRGLEGNMLSVARHIADYHMPAHFYRGEA